MVVHFFTGCSCICGEKDKKEKEEEKKKKKKCYTWVQNGVFDSKHSNITPLMTSFGTQKHVATNIGNITFPSNCREKDILFQLLLSLIII